MSRRRNKVKPPENHERWLITYADLITLLMIFFVVLYAMSKVDAAKFQTLAMSLNQALYASNQVQLQSLGSDGLITQRGTEPNSNPNQVPNPPITQQDIDQLKKMQQETLQLQDTLKKLTEFVKNNGLQDKVQLTETSRGVQITLRDVALFNLGSATLNQDASRILGGIAPFLKVLPNAISVEGHTDNIPIRSAAFSSNWELSTARALNVLHYFESSGIPSQRMSATGLGEYRPIASNDTAEGRSANRRVNVILLRSDKTF